MLTKRRFKRQNSINWESTNCYIWFSLPTPASYFPSEKITTFLGFIVEKEDPLIQLKHTSKKSIVCCFFIDVSIFTSSTEKYFFDEKKVPFGFDI